MVRVVLLAALLSSCAAGAPRTSPSQLEEVRVETSSAPLVSAAPPRPTLQSCVARMQPAKLELRGAKVVAEIQGITYATALQKQGNDYVPVLLWLTLDGTLAFYPLVREGIQAASQGNRLHLLSLSKDWKELYIESIDLSRSDAPERKTEERLQGMQGGSLGTFAADEERALIDGSFYRNNQHERVAFEYDRARRLARERAQLALLNATYCNGTACVLVGVDQAANRSIVLYEPHSGGSPESFVLGPLPASLVYRVPGENGNVLLLTTDAQGWTGVEVRKASPALKAIPGVAGTTGQCRGHTVVGRPWPGVIACHGELRTLIRWEQGRLVSEPLPSSLHREEDYTAFGNSLVRLAWSGGSGLMHGPEYRGIREYHQHWSFEGGSTTLLERKDGKWSTGESAPLVLSHARGEFSHGYRPILLQRGARLSVLLTTDGFGDAAHLQPVREPCEGAN